MSSRDAGDETRPAAGREVGQTARRLQARQAYDAYLESVRCEQAPDQGDAEGRVIDVGVAVDGHDLELLPPALPGVILRYRQVRLGSGTPRRLLRSRELNERGHPVLITAGAM